jgi:Ca2+/Na+ antiporter
MNLISHLLYHHYTGFADDLGNTKKAYSRFLYSAFYIFSLNILACLNYIYLFYNLRLRFYLIILVALYYAFFFFFKKIMNYNRLYNDYNEKSANSDYDFLGSLIKGLPDLLISILSLVHICISGSILAEKGPIYKLLVYFFS